jgi:hypothetical protein
VAEAPTTVERGAFANTSRGSRRQLEYLEILWGMVEVSKQQ